MVEGAAKESGTAKVLGDGLIHLGFVEGFL